MNALDIIGYIALGALRLAGFFAIILLTIGVFAYGAEYVINPVIKRTPQWLANLWGTFWRCFIIVFGVSFFLFILYQIGVG